MSLLTPEQVRAVRLKGSKLIDLERVGIKVRVVATSGDAALQLKEWRSERPDDQRGLFVKMLAASVATEQGDLLSDEDARQLFGLLLLDETVMLITEVNEMLGGGLGKAKGEANGTSSSVSVSPLATSIPTTSSPS